MVLVEEKALMLKNSCVGPNLHLMTLYAPLIAKSVLPGQFVHMALPGAEGHILRRPFSVYERDVETGAIDILYREVGFGSSYLSRLDTCEQEMWVSLIGPVGTGWQAPKNTKRALLVGGGLGAAPLFLLCKKLLSEGVDVCVVLGAQTKDAQVCYNRYKELLGVVGSSAQDCAEGPFASPGFSVGEKLRCATDDGSFGHAGFCTALVEEELSVAASAQKPYDYVAVCGPEPLMRIVAGMAAEAQVFCEVSLERRMACGVGACLSCVVDTTSGKKRSCVDGPVFSASEVCW